VPYPAGHQQKQGVGRDLMCWLLATLFWFVAIVCTYPPPQWASRWSDAIRILGLFMFLAGVAALLADIISVARQSGSN
jgi:hypothetical protein